VDSTTHDPTSETQLESISDDIGLVVIGRNEGDRLVRCLHSVPRGLAVIYVDSGSTDGSIDRARAVGVRAHALTSERPFSAARARNEGFEILVKENPRVRWVQFLDGDCELARGWLSRARRALEGRSSVVAVHGRVIERDPQASVYNRLHELEWSACEPGDVGSFGGNFMVRTDAFSAVRGFDPVVIAAEDDELALRLRRAGGVIVRLAHPMVHHDAAMTRFGQWWRRSVRLGHAYAQLVDMHGRGPERYFVPERRRSLTWGLVLPSSIVALIVPSAGLSLTMLAMYPMQLARLTLQARQRSLSPRQSLLWASACVVSRFAETTGIARYHLDKARGRTTRIIEHKESVRAKA
jgi:GT2 family glycosyltransferase